MKKVIWVSLVLLVASLLSQPVLADQGEQEKASGPWERFSFSLGGFFVDLSSDVRIGSKTLGVGTDIDVEDALGLDSSTLVFRSDALYRFGKSRRHRIDFTYFDLSRDSTKTLERDIDFGEKHFTVRTTLDSEFDLVFYNLAYTYSFFQDDRFDLGASVGFHIMDIGLKLTISALGTAEEEKITAPLPVLGLRGTFALTPRLFLKQSIEFFYLEIDNFKGLLTDINLALEYNAWKHVGLGIGYNTMRLNIEADGKDYPEIDFIGNLEFTYGGIQLYAKVYF